MQVPMNSGLTLEVALKMFTEGIKDDKYNWVWLDTVLWPLNTPCAFYGIQDKSQTTCIN